MSLTKSEVVLDLYEANNIMASYVSLDEDTMGPQTLVSITPEKFADFGCPQKITVTLEPGDKLNES